MFFSLSAPGDNVVRPLIAVSCRGFQSIAYEPNFSTLHEAAPVLKEAVEKYVSAVHKHGYHLADLTLTDQRVQAALHCADQRCFIASVTV